MAQNEIPFSKPRLLVWKAFRGDGALTWVGIGVCAPKERGVYVWHSDNESTRAYGTRSDIAYIGRAAYGVNGNLAHRLRYHELRGFALQVTWRTCSSYEEAEQLEDRLLRLYRSIHDQLPPYNKINASRTRLRAARRSVVHPYATA